MQHIGGREDREGSSWAPEGEPVSLPRLRPPRPISGAVDGVSRPHAPSQVPRAGGPNLRTGQKAGEKTGFRHMQV